MRNKTQKNQLLFQKNTKICSIICIIQKFVVSLHCQNKKDVIMKTKQKKIKLEVTPEEDELIHAIRNYIKSFPNGEPQLLWYAQELFDKMIDMPKDEIEFPR